MSEKNETVMSEAMKKAEENKKNSKKKAKKRIKKSPGLFSKLNPKGLVKWFTFKRLVYAGIGAFTVAMAVTVGVAVYNYLYPDPWYVKALSVFF